MIKQLARFAAGLMPGSIRARLAQYRFGYSGGAPEIPLARDIHPDATFSVRLERGPAFVLTPDLEPDYQDHFAADGDSRGEMAGFLELSRASAFAAVLLDIGAHKGLFSLVHLVTGPGHRALLVEPSPVLCRDASDLMHRNGVEARADIVVAGAAATAGVRRIVVDALGFARAATDEAGAVDVPFVTVDELCVARAIVPAIVKIDVEGAEAEVLRGAIATLRAHRPVLCLELHNDLLEQRGESPAALLDGLSRLGYRFETPSGVPLPAWRLGRSLKAIVRIVAR